MEEEAKSEHVVLFPFMAQGHITPFLALAGLLSSRHPNLAVTLVNTPYNIQTLTKSRAGAAIPSSIRLRSLPFSPEEHGLPPAADNTAELPFFQIVTLFEASKSLRSAFEQIISDISEQDGRPPRYIVSDIFLTWTIDTARRFGSFHSIFVTSSAYGTVVFSSMWKHLPHRRADCGDLFPLPDFPDVLIHRSQIPKHQLLADDASPWTVFLREQTSRFSETDAVLINTVEEVERRGLQMMRQMLPCSIWPIGPLLSSVLPSISSGGGGGEQIIQWLDSQPPASVLYISFGSQNTITASQMMELATGLEASGVRFVWVIRPPVGSDVKSEFEAEWLPEKFEERMQAQGRSLLVHGWAPQMEILSHPATGAFLSHCGWNSVLESLNRGVPMLAWPLTADQFFNANMLEKELGVCVEVGRGNMENSMADRVAVERMVKEVMCGGEIGGEMRRRVEEVRELMKAAWMEGLGSSLRGLSEFFRAAAAADRRR
ncbi:UDP-glycosyltransferase 92A1-like [Zingiber officinale]|uniref:Glycosyltransferase n=1 Tax=Zingiber officinale TaxID=94328 RepID=A0A8J5GXP9_ZINOF|nr:UDP-glycosyltransferase 92A1-like [Zingiber officinale]KAG6513718.1 hypothetical protein ZIOFF_024054 [Zingiber officinale]